MPAGPDDGVAESLVLRVESIAYLPRVRGRLGMNPAPLRTSVVARGEPTMPPRVRCGARRHSVALL